MATVRAVIAKAAAKGWILHQFDVNNAFLHGDLQEEVYMEQPPSYHDTGHSDYVRKLQKALFGLKQAHRAWHDTIAQYLITIGFHMADADHLLYVQKTNVGIVIITIYVDDLIIGGDAYALFLYFSQALTLHEQKKYGLNMLMKYGMADCKPISTLWDENFKLKIDEGEVLDDATMYRGIVGSFIYMTISQPYLSYAIGLVSQFMQLPRKPRLDAVRRIKTYVRATLDYVFFYDADTQVQVHGYTDFDWVGRVFDRRSTNGYMFSFGIVFCCTWSSKNQPTVALSNTEVEYRGATVVACEVAWLEMLLQDLEI
ncbi:hypothetical protein L7F22_001785 [Adiantum nelumboides]|nr:hypothetical protein [Adiantum nelumboides]